MAEAGSVYLTLKLATKLFEKPLEALAADELRRVKTAALREQLGIKDGDQLIWEVRDGELVVTTRVAQLRRTQALIHRYVAESVSLADELICERRVDQTKEDAV